MRGAAAVVVALAALAGGLAACETVDLGTPPADINACRPGQRFFVDQIWPNVLNKDYGGRRCGDASCHDPASGRSLSLAPPMPLDPMALIPPLPTDWMANYRSAAEHMNCSTVAASQLYTLPTELRTHGGRMLFAPDSEEAMLILMWVGQP